LRRPAASRDRWRVTVPEILTRTAKALAGFQPVWVLCGGWAVDAWLGRETRMHLDVDLAIAVEDQRAVLDYLRGWHVRGHDDEDDSTTEQWDGRRLAFPGHIHATSPDGIELDIQLNRWNASRWELSTEPRITLPVTRSSRPTPWGLPAATPDIVLFYKASERPRPHDDLDFQALVPLLSDAERYWLWEAIVLAHPTCPWLPHLSAMIA
jgi:hypothetical protein